jgi:hypothetical protein
MLAKQSRPSMSVWLLVQGIYIPYPLGCVNPLMIFKHTSQGLSRGNVSGNRAYVAVVYPCLELRCTYNVRGAGPSPTLSSPTLMTSILASPYLENRGG